MPRYTLPLLEERDLALQQLQVRPGRRWSLVYCLCVLNTAFSVCTCTCTPQQAICSQGFFSVKDFHTNPHRIFAAHELTGLMNPSTATKLTVQFNLFGGSVLKLG